MPTTDTVDRHRSVRRAWFWLAVAHIAILPLVAAMSYWQVAPSLLNLAVAGQVFLLALWLVMGKAHLAYRFAFAIGCGIFLQIILLVLPRIAAGISGYPAVSPAIFSTLIMQGVIAIPLSYLKNTGWRLVHKSEKLVTPHGTPLQFRVSHLFVLTVLLAVFLTIRIYVHSAGHIRQSGAIGFGEDSSGSQFGFVLAMLAVAGGTTLLLSTAVITGFWACLGPHRPGYRLLVTAISVAVLCAFPLHINGGHYHAMWAVGILSFMTVIIASLLFLRKLGVRLVRLTSLRHIFANLEES